MRSPGRRVRGSNPGTDNGRSIDEIYGLEPLLEPEADTVGAREGVQFQRVECPYCGESFETQVDVSSGSSSYIEDCQICCQPIQFAIDLDDTGSLSSVTVRRSDD